MMFVKEFLKRSSGKELFLFYFGLGMILIVGYLKKLVFFKIIFILEELK